MSRFYGSIQSGEGEATRTGTAKSGMIGHIRGWDIGCRVEMRADGDEDICEVWLTSGSRGRFSANYLGTFRPEDVVTLLPDRDDVTAELLAALERARDHLIMDIGPDGKGIHSTDTPGALDQARAAIDKAKRGA